MVRSLSLFACVLSLAAPAFADDADPSKMTCADMMSMQAESMMKRGKTLQKGAAMMAARAAMMKKNKDWKADGAIQARMAKGMMASGKAMEKGGKWLAGQAKNKAKHAHTMADAMAAMAKMPADKLAKAGAAMKEFATEMKEWGGEMIKHGDMMLGMVEKMSAGAAAGAGSAEASGSASGSGSK